MSLSLRGAAQLSMTVTLLFTQKEGQWDLCLCRHIPGSWAAAPRQPPQIEEASRGVRGPHGDSRYHAYLFRTKGGGAAPTAAEMCSGCCHYFTPTFHTALPSGLCDLSTCSRHETRPPESKPPAMGHLCYNRFSLCDVTELQPVNRPRALTPGCPSS